MTTPSGGVKGRVGHEWDEGDGVRLKGVLRDGSPVEEVLEEGVES